VDGSIDTPRVPTPRRRILGIRMPHLHRFRWAGEDAFSSASLYRCACGVVRSAL
jgi:hypothetical protein